jgi:hypothetical protein
LKQIGIPVYAVELAFGEDKYVLNNNDATFLKQVRSKDFMFQKERMLNLILEDVPEKYNEIVWMDCDVLYLENDWHKRTSELLKEHKVIQPYAYAVSLPSCKVSQVSYAYWVYYDCNGSGRLTRSFAHYASRRTNYATLHGGHLGYVWAARRDFLEKHKFYDPIISGAGDLFMAMAFTGYLGWIDYQHELRLLSDRACVHFFEWAIPVLMETKGKVPYTVDQIVHLWHGDINTRNYLTSTQHLQINNFDPTTDLRISENGCWEWNSKKPKLHAAMKDLFERQRIN